MFTKYNNDKVEFLIRFGQSGEWLALVLVFFVVQWMSRGEIEIAQLHLLKSGIVQLLARKKWPSWKLRMSLGDYVILISN